MRRIITNLSLVLSGIFAGILLAEIILRIAGFSFPGFHRYDMYTGTSLRENTEGWYRAEGESYVRINGQGMRDDREITERKAQGVYRIAVLGDSFAEALQVPVEKTFARVLERKLNECKPYGEKTVEILNFGVSGYSTAQELQALRYRVWKFHPDMVLLAFYSENDVFDNSREYAGRPPRPFFVYQNDQLVLDDSFLDSWSYQLGSSAPWLMYQNISQHSRVAQLLNKVKNIAQQSIRTPPKHVAAKNDDGKLYDYENIYLPPQNDDLENAWRVTEGLLVQMRNEVAAKGAAFVVVTLSNAIQVDPDSGKRAEHARHLEAADLFYPDRRIKALGDREGINVISLVEPFQKYAQAYRIHLHGFPNSGLGSGHWNEYGHGLAGKIISENLCMNKP